MIVLSFKPAKLVHFFALVVMALLIVHVTAISIYYGDLFSLNDNLNIKYWHISVFDLDEEESFGTWFSSLILFISALLLAVIANHSHDTNDSPYPWWILAGIFLCLSIDEVVGIHEYLNSMFDDTPWTHIAIPLIGCLAIGYLPFLIRLPARSRWLFLLAGTIYIGGAVGIEKYTDWYQDEDLLDSLAYNLWTTVEEGMEMTGIIIFIHALFGHLLGNVCYKTIVSFELNVKADNN